MPEKSLSEEGISKEPVLEEREVENKDNVFKSTLTPAVCLFHRLHLFYRKPEGC